MVAFSCSSTKANLEVRSIATRRYSLPSGSDLGDVDVEIAHRVGLELAPCWLVALYVWQPADTVALKTPVQRRAREVRNRPLERVEAVVQRQQRVGPARATASTAIGTAGAIWSVGRSAADLRFLHFAMVFWLTPWRLASALRLS